MKLKNLISTKETKKLVNDNYFNSLPILEQILLETYTLISENIDIDNIYQYSKIGKFIFEFNDKNNINHKIKLNYNPGLKEKELTVKFGWEKDGKISYEKPPFTDEKVFNTHLNIFVKYILPYLQEVGNDLGVNKLTLDATDQSRFRLYKIAINKIIDKSKFSINFNKNLIFIKIK